MCRRCGERDKRGPAKHRRARKQFILDRDGDGTHVDCTWKISPKCPGTLDFVTMQVDRIIPGGSYYDKGNIVAACGPCNIARCYATVAVPDGCVFGPVDEADEPPSAAPGEIVGGYVDDQGRPVEDDTQTAVA